MTHFQRTHRHHCFARLAVAVALATAGRTHAATAATEPDPGCARIVAVGDLHGGYDPFTRILIATKLVDESLNRIDPSSCLVQLGDVVDRGARSRDILDLLIRLTADAPQRVHALLGNHEIMNLLGDLRYVDPAELLAFQDLETTAARAELFSSFRRATAGDLDAATAQAVFDQRFPPGWLGHRHAFSATGRYGAWLRTRPALVVIDGTLFVHGGISAADAGLGIATLNQHIRSELQEFDQLRTTLLGARWLAPFMDYRESMLTVAERIGSKRSGTSPELVPIAEQFLALGQATMTRPDGPLWIRDLALADEGAYAATLTRTLATLGVDRVVVAHTTRQSHRIEQRFGGRVFIIDTGAGPAYGGRASALEIRPQQGIYAVYEDSSELLVDLSPPDSDTESLLKDGEVIDSKEIGKGITRPKRLTLRGSHETIRAAFKTVAQEQEHRPGRPLHASNDASDHYKNEVAAYRLDRALGLHMVPVATVRSVDGTKGAAIAWIDDAVDEAARIEANLEPRDPDDFRRQHESMELFDALIGNADRNLGNRLYTTRGGLKLHLIDHSRSFRVGAALPERFLAHPTRLSRVVYQRLQDLTEASLRDLFDGLVARMRVDAVIARRDAIVRKVEAERIARGDEQIFYEDIAQAIAAGRVVAMPRITTSGVRILSD